MKNSFKFFLTFVAAVSLCVFLIFSPNSFVIRPFQAPIYKELGLFVDVISMIQQNYVEVVPTKKLVSGALRGMLQSLDPYSQFLDENSYSDLKIEADGKFAGIGLEVSTKGGTLHVITALDDTPADRAGIKPADTILKIDDAPTRDMSLEQAVKKMRGVPGTTVKLTVMREKESKLTDLVIARDFIKIKSIKEAKLVDGKVGYIRLSAFQENSASDLEASLKDLEKQGMEGLILDIRNNSGGLFTSAIEIAEEFVPQGQVIVATKARDAKNNRQFISSAKNIRKVEPFVLLVNKGSASSSEILAGAIQDHKLGTLVGTKTFGKGSIQTLVPLPDKTALRLTTSRYYTPNGRLIHEVGIVPDIIVEPGDGKENKDAQLERALQVIQDLKTSHA